MSLVITDIGELVTGDPELGAGALGVLSGAALVIDGDRVVWAGPSRSAPAADRAYDAGGRAVLPGFVDSHAHLVFAGDRSAEFEARMSGRRYEAGGIATTVAATRTAGDGELRAGLRARLAEMYAQGTTTVECKSGYGLTVADEERAVRIAAESADEVTFLGAHVVPAEYAEDPGGYVRLVTTEMLAACAPYARWIDVFCERGAFDADQTEEILRAGVAAGLTPRVHAGQLGPGPARWRRCCRERSSRPGSHIRTPAA